MGSEIEMIPCLDFHKLQEGSEGWKEMSKKVREACESYGCFFLMCDEISSDLREQMFKGMKALFDLPEEIKKKHVTPVPYSGYLNKMPSIPLCETFRIEDINLPAITHHFTNLMWPEGNPSFCETLNFMSSKMMELCFLILKLILKGYDLPQNYILDVEEMKSICDSRLTRYAAPKNNISKNNSEIAMMPHTDKSTMTILCDNEVQGLEVLTKSGKWIELKIPPNAFVVIVGDMLKVWSNGRLQLPTHRVVMKGDKDRYSFMIFASPKEEKVIKVPCELVDDKMHPLRYRLFKYKEYIHRRVSSQRDKNVLEEFAGL